MSIPHGVNRSGVSPAVIGELPTSRSQMLDTRTFQRFSQSVLYTRLFEVLEPAYRSFTTNSPLVFYSTATILPRIHLTTMSGNTQNYKQDSRGTAPSPQGNNGTTHKPSAQATHVTSGSTPLGGRNADTAQPGVPGKSATLPPGYTQATNPPVFPPRNNKLPDLPVDDKSPLSEMVREVLDLCHVANTITRDLELLRPAVDSQETPTEIWEKFYRVLNDQRDVLSNAKAAFTEIRSSIDAVLEAVSYSQSHSAGEESDYHSVEVAQTYLETLYKDNSDAIAEPGSEPFLPTVDRHSPYTHANSGYKQRQAAEAYDGTGSEGMNDYAYDSVTNRSYVDPLSRSHEGGRQPRSKLKGAVNALFNSDPIKRIERDVKNLKGRCDAFEPRFHGAAASTRNIVQSKGDVAQLCNRLRNLSDALGHFLGTEVPSSANPPPPSNNVGSVNQMPQQRRTQLPPNSN